MKEEILENVSWLLNQAPLSASDALKLAIEMQKNQITKEQNAKLKEIANNIHYLALRTH